MFTPSTVVKQSASQVSCTLNDEIAILSLDKAVYFGLEGIGADLWQALEKPHSVADLCKLILESYDVSAQQCESDVLQFLQKMQEAGLLETVN
jgi:hypothetical protein